MERILKYSRISTDEKRSTSFEADIEDNTSDTTKVSSTELLLNKDSAIGEHHNKLHNKSSRRDDEFATFWTWFRWAAITGLQIIIILLLSSAPSQRGPDEESFVIPGPSVEYDKTVETGGDINGLYKTLSHTYSFLKDDPEKYVPNMKSIENRAEIKRNWDLLMPRGSGSVLIPNYRDYPLLGDPMNKTAPVFQTAWAHALHCLYSTVDNFHQLKVNGRIENENPSHTTHCLEYLRNHILCNLDMTLEGSMSKPENKSGGQPHVCRNKEEALKWIEERKKDDLQDIMGV